MQNSMLEQAVKLHQEGQLDAAKQMYEQLLNDSTQPLDNLIKNSVVHNLGTIKVAQGSLKSGIALINQAIVGATDNPELLHTFKLVGTELYKNGHWEEARDWLEKALLHLPDDAELKFMHNRVLPRYYLKPEYYDPLANQALLRYSPREADTYVYTIDISGTCNLRCPTCPVGNYSAADRTTGFMSLEMFRQIITKIQSEKVTDKPQVWLYNWGEPLLHPELAEIISTVKKAGLSCHLSSNLNVEKGIQALAKSNPDEIKISLSGFTQDTYSQTHKRGDIFLLKSNMYQLRYFINKYKSTSRVWVGHHLYKNNVHQMDTVKALCEELAFEYHPTQAFFQPLEKLIGFMEGKVSPSDQTTLDNLLMEPKLNIENIKQHRSGHYDCELRFNQTVINHDGEVALCCSTYDKGGMLGLSFLEFPHETIEQKKYQHELCKQCRHHGCDYSVTEAMDR